MREPNRLKWVVTFASLALAAVHQWLPEFTMDLSTIILLVIAALPWMQPLVKSIELMGVKLELQDLKEQIAEAKGTAESAKQKAFFAQTSNTSASLAPPTAEVSTAQSHSLASLADLYEQIRANQDSSDERTLAMTEVVHKMIDLAETSEGFDITKELRSRRPGRRLAAYAILFARPNRALLSELVDSIAGIEDKPFGQYWGLLAVGRAVDIDAAKVPIPAEIVSSLSGLLLKFKRGTDRDYELRQILARIRSRR